ncbi:hypothetical protein SAMN04488026_10982 [Aliiruegeria lutimaris]|uniref:Uncharacterized protein n=1 Tax=Aliiruegeria lutimaris TaxID=571298 RepID=A0A1G9LIB0_9RHOB|nr:hypothetical protein SAMN04488026_10982 [Aliiruegeria lutimaris]
MTTIHPRVDVAGLPMRSDILKFDSKADKQLISFT